MHPRARRVLVSNVNKSLRFLTRTTVLTSLRQPRSEPALEPTAISAISRAAALPQPELIPRGVNWQPSTTEYALMAALNPDFGPLGLPPLPAIRDDALRVQALTHRSFASRRAHVFEDLPDDPSPDNEMLEHLGDTVLNLVVTNMLRDMYPRLKVGPSTKLRALLVGNATLAGISSNYRLQHWLRVSAAAAITLRSSLKVQADVFESYVGALYLDQGLEAVKSWLIRLLAPYAKEAYTLIRAQHGLAPAPPAIDLTENVLAPTPSIPTVPYATPPSTPGFDLAAQSGYLELFNQQIAQQGKFVEWVFDVNTGDGLGTRADPIQIDVDPGIAPAGSHTTPIWHVEAVIDGECVGRGKGRTKQAAKNDAAREALVGMGINVSETPILQ